jgi:hypothetical protein
VQSGLFLKGLRRRKGPGLRSHREFDGGEAKAGIQTSGLGTQPQPCGLGGAAHVLLLAALSCPQPGSYTDTSYPRAFAPAAFSLHWDSVQAPPSREV